MEEIKKKDNNIIEQKKKKVEEKIKAYQDLISLKEKYIKLNEELDELIIDIKKEDIDIILDYTSSIFFELCLKLTGGELIALQDKLSKLYHKLKNLYFFNIMTSLFRKIESISHEIENKYNSLNFSTDKDIILKSEYEYEKNENSVYKSLGLNIKSTSYEKFKFLTEKLEEIYNKENIFLNYDILKGDYEDGYTLKVKFNDENLICNDSKSIKDMRELLKKYGIENNSWFDMDDEEREKRRRPINLQTEEEKEEKRKQEELKKINHEKLIISLLKQEKYIKMKFQGTKKNTRIYKNIFFDLKKIILSNVLVKDKIIQILPYGSVTQCTNNEQSDVEMTIITKNYASASKEYISQIINDIKEKIEIENNDEFEIYLEGIRETKRTTLLLLRHKETKTEIEINCNNFFSVMNSNLIRNYFVYDARALILINTIKDWSKIKKINSNNKHFISSYCYTLMTIYFLQRIKYPLLPILSSYNNLVNLKVNEKEYFIEKELLEYKELKNWHSPNKEDTVSTLLLKWMIFYLYLFNEEEYIIDISNKKLTFRFNEAKFLTSSVRENKLSAYCFIDMFDYTYNPGSYMEYNTYEHRMFKDVLKESIELLLEGKKEFFYESNN